MHNGAIKPTDVRCLVDADESSAIVRLTGVLDPAGTDAVRDALLARLWQRPGPVIVDLSRVVGPHARAVVDQVHRAVADWPAAGILVLDPATGEGTLGAGPGAAPVYPSLGEARAALVDAPLAAPRGGSALHLAVRDHSGRRPAYAGLAPVNSAGGRGLLLVDAVARRWDSTSLPDSKVVWCVLHVEDEAELRK